MRFRPAVFLSLFLFASSAFAVDRWIPIAGTVANFRTDSRILNPSGEKDIEVSAYFLPAGATNNAAVVAGTPKKITVAKRSMVVLDDVVTTVFAAGGIGAILLTSPDNFIATSRIYATVATGTLGQFTVALPPGQAYTKGTVIQLQSDSIFRTNVGAVNIANATTEVTWNLYDKTNKKVSTVTKTMVAYEVLGPSNIATFFPNIPSTADLSQAWVTYQSTNPIFAYGSSRDLRTDDPIYIPGEQDTGSDPVVIQPTVKEFSVSLVNFDVVVDNTGLSNLKVGDAVKMTVQSTEGNHGFAMVGPDGAVVVPDNLYSQGGAAKEFNFTVTRTGEYTYFCTFASCGVGHSAMFGTFRVR